MNTLHGNEYLGMRKVDAATAAVRRPVLMVTRRCLRAGQQGQFDRVLRSFLNFAVSFPGHLDAHVLSWTRGEAIGFAIVHRFSDATSRQKFVCSPNYRVWLIWLQQFTDAANSDKATPQTVPPPSRRLALAGAFLAFVLFGLAGILPAVVYLELPAWHAGLGQILAGVLLLVTAGLIGVMVWPARYDHHPQRTFQNLALPVIATKRTNVG
jgi:hypothetical protein